MEYGLIGNPLGHSISPAIHACFHNGIDYQLHPVETEEALKQFLEERNFKAVNVTIPWKQKVIPYLDELDPAARAIGAVNCIVNDHGRLTGHNTDVSGFRQMMERNHVSLSGKTAVLGTGGASHAVCQAVVDLGGSVVLVSRHPREGSRFSMISYPELMASSFDVLINTTPVGMSPDCDAAPVEIGKLSSVHTVADIIANPLRTKLQFEAQLAGKKAYGGLEMLVRQAARAQELFFGTAVDEKAVMSCLWQMKMMQSNVVLIGMPSSGKTVVGRMLAQQLGWDFVEMDAELVKRFGTSIRNVFETKGETWFRDQETKLIEDLRSKKRTVISTGGGVIKRVENMRMLAENGVVIWLDRSPMLLHGTSERPLSPDDDAIRRLYEERLPLYRLYSDRCVENNRQLNETVHAIEEIVRGVN